MTLWAFPRQLAAALPRAWRSLTRRPGAFAIAVSSLAVALGLATTVIAHVDSLLHPDLGTPHDSRLFLAQAAGRGQTTPTDDEVLQLFRAVPTVERAEFAKRTAGVPVEVGGSAGDRAVWRVSPGYFDVMQTKPVRGRFFRANETASSGVALVTEDAWFNRLGATESLDSARVVVNGLRYTVIGVVPRNLPPFIQTSSGPGARPEDVILLANTNPDGSSDNWPGYALLYARPGVSSNEMSKAVAPIAAKLISAHGVGSYPYAVWAAPLSAFRHVQVAGYQKGMLLAAGIIVLIACANVSALMLARAVAKRRDQALRLALGAGHRHIIGDVAAEVAVIAVTGGVAALAIGYWSMRILAAVTPPDLPWLGFREPHWSPWVFAGLFAVVMLAVIVASIVPALFVSRIAPVEQLKDNSGTTTGRPKRTFQVLVVGELALSLCLLFGAVLVTRSANTVADFDFGYNAHSLVRVYAEVRVVEKPVNVDCDRTGRAADAPRRSQCYPHRQIGFDAPETIAERLRGVPGVRNASWMIGDYDMSNMVMSDESSASDRTLIGATRMFVGSDFLRTLGLQLVAGRDFVAGDRERGAVILDELAARKLFAGGDAAGKLVKLDRFRSNAPWLRVVGVVRTARHSMPEDPAVPPTAAVYVSQARAGGYPNFVARPEQSAGDIRPAVAAVVSDLLPPRTTFSTGKWVARYDQMLTTRRFTAGMFLTLSIASLVLAAAGLFGVLSYAVNQRMREFAVRVALGAQRGHVVRLVVHDGLVMALGGTAIGASVAMYGAFSLWQWLWGVYPVDAPALLIAEGVLLSVTMAGAVLPAIRATRANPVDVMRAT